MRRLVHRHRKRVQEIGLGLTLYESFNFLYDWLAYPLALAYFGLEKGALILVAGSLIQCAFMFWLYDRMRIDWLGAHALRELEAKENKNRFEHAAVWLARDKHTAWEKLITPIVFIALTLPIDPLIVALHYRKKHFHGVTMRDWGILLSAVLAANLWWLVKVGLVVEIVRAVIGAWWASLH